MLAFILGLLAAMAAASVQVQATVHHRVHGPMRLPGRFDRLVSWCVAMHTSEHEVTSEEGPQPHGISCLLDLMICLHRDLL